MKSSPGTSRLGV